MLLVDGVEIKDPSEFTWDLNDISDSSSGRTQDGTMYKNRVAKKRKLSLVWWNPTPEEASKIITAFDPVYVSVSYPDAQSGQTETRTFYRSDPTAPVRSWAAGCRRYSKVSFNLIER